MILNEMHLKNCLMSNFDIFTMIWTPNICIHNILFPSKLDTISLFKWKMYNYNNKKGKDEEHVSDQRL